MAATDSTADDTGLRSDARENRARILQAAVDVAAESDKQASLTRIAQRAGVGIGTLYRHFPTRDHLVEAVHRERVVRVAEKAGAYVAERTATEAMRAWMADYVEMLVTYRGVPQALQSQLEPGSSLRAESAQLLTGAVDELLVAGRREGVIREDVAAVDVLRLLTGITVVSGNLKNTDVLLDVIVRGLAPRRVE